MSSSAGYPQGALLEMAKMGDAADAANVTTPTAVADEDKFYDDVGGAPEQTDLRGGCGGGVEKRVSTTMNGALFLRIEGL
ncbi:hypothetical protein HPB47_002627 [Ixodes persulcatus]|uniref:Uncharacterized protein n=1 Tax=Ixodes persulcatus TaxID=34615 RepID=A0AC60PKS5_IXOPE|nr:hypothetical protein HPB47_002627 [Ixodes persulcatus]